MRFKKHITAPISGAVSRQIECSLCRVPVVVRGPDVVFTWQSLGRKVSKEINFWASALLGLLILLQYDRNLQNYESIGMMAESGLRRTDA
jgi:hypothetical protein